MWSNADRRSIQGVPNERSDAMSPLGLRHDLALTLPTAQAVAGEELQVTAALPAADRHAHAARVELAYRNTYRHDVRDPGETSIRGTVKTTDDVIVDRHEITLGEEPATSEVQLRVPLSAPGTVAGIVEWEVRLIVDRHHARDHRTTQPLTVLAPADALADRAQQPAVGNADWMELEVTTRLARPGDTLRGHLNLRPTEAVHGRAVRVQLRRRRDDPDANVDQHVEAEVTLLGKGDLAAGMPQSLPFEITVPATATPSFDAAHNRQQWWLEGVVDIPHHVDKTHGVEIVVHTA
jgi:hypothetical protein